MVLKYLITDRFFFLRHNYHVDHCSLPFIVAMDCIIE